MYIQVNMQCRFVYLPQRHKRPWRPPSPRQNAMALTSYGNPRQALYSHSAVIIKMHMVVMPVPKKICLTDCNLSQSGTGIRRVPAIFLQRFNGTAKCRPPFLPWPVPYSVVTLPQLVDPPGNRALKGALQLADILGLVKFLLSFFHKHFYLGAFMPTRRQKEHKAEPDLNQLYHKTHQLVV